MKDINTDTVEHIIHIITAPPAKDDSEAEWERIQQLDNAWSGHQIKYGDAMLHEIQWAISAVVYDIVSKAKEGAYEQD